MTFDPLPGPHDPLAELAAEAERNRRRLIESTQLLAAISELLSAVVFSGDPDPSLRSLCHFLRGAFRLDWVHIGILDPESSKLGGPVVRVEPGGGVRDGRLSHRWPGAGLLGRVVDEHRSEVLRHREAQAAMAELDARTAYPLELIACLPIGRIEGGVATRPGEAPGPVRGVLALGRSSDEDLDPDHRALLESLAASIGTALDNARLTARLADAIRFRDHVLESMLDGVLAVDGEGEVLVMNEVAETLLALSRDGALGRPFPQGLLQVGDPPADALASAGVESANTRRSEGWVSPPGRERRPVSLTTTQLRDEKGRVYGTLVTFFDLTAFREMERKIRHLDRIAVLGRFTSAVAHEIRNPLTGIGAGIEYLSRGIPPDDARRPQLEFLIREVARLDRIVSDLSYAARPRDPEPRPIRIETLAADAVQAIRNRPEAAQAVIETELARDLPPALVDPDHLTQVLVNLLLNAVQAGGGEGRPVKVRAWVNPPVSGQLGRVSIAVEDSGPGIPADNLERIFEPFFTTKKAGTGLGLYLCHEMVKRNGGEITAGNRPGGGAVFLIELPASPAVAGVGRAASHSIE